MSAAANSAEKLNALDATAYFPKPLDLEALLRTIAHYCSLSGPPVEG
jgi:hypothetical protein